MRQELGYHAIRLRGPWHFLKSVAGNEQVVLRQPFDRGLPADWGLPGTSIAAKRKFNRPTQLASDQRLQIAIRMLRPLSGVSLNDLPLGCTSRGFWEPLTEWLVLDITPMVESHNELRIEFDAASLDPRTGQVPFSEVELRIATPEMGQVGAVARGR